MKKVILALMAALMVLPFSVAAKKRKPAEEPSPPVDTPGSV